MLNHIKADLYRIIPRKSFIVLTAVWTIVVVLAVVGLSSKYSAEQVLSAYPAVSYFVYLLLAVLISDYTFREELQLKVIKNDMTTGISRSGFYTAKFLSGVILIVCVWLVITLAACVAAGFIDSPAGAVDFFASLLSTKQFMLMFQVFFVLGIFQLIGLFVQKTILMLLVCVVLQQAFKVMGEQIAVVQKIINLVNSDGIGGLMWTTLGIAAVVYAGCLMFNRKEL